MTLVAFALIDGLGEYPFDQFMQHGGRERAAGQTELQMQSVGFETPIEIQHGNSQRAPLLFETGLCKTRGQRRFLIGHLPLQIGNLTLR